MSIQVFCPECKTSSGLDAELCSKCKKPFGRSRKYRVQVSVKGQRSTRVVDNLTVAREVESALKSDMVREEFDVSHHKTKQKTMTVGELWKSIISHGPKYTRNLGKPTVGIITVTWKHCSLSSCLIQYRRLILRE